jgi:NAD(P)-dependent dehydrogenase (short-subunit alcohol dehydrogenase family)
MNSMNGKIVLITGGTNGIGKSTAEGLAKMGATVVVVGRDPQKTEQVVAALRQSTGNPTLEGLVADLSSQQDIRRLASEFKTKYKRLHVLVNNAGAIFADRQLTVDGIERTFALNHLAYFLLTNLLLDTLKASAPSRIINVSSAAHRWGRIRFDNLQGEKSYHRMLAYGSSKLANILFTIELARRLEGSGVTVNALHPGFINSGFGKNNTDRGLSANFYAKIAPFFSRTPAEGARTSILLASSPALEGVTGAYFANSKIAGTSAAAKDVADARSLWDISAKMVHWTG